MVTIKTHSLFLRHLQYIVTITICWLVYYFVGIGCPIYALFGISCPTCGVTRALAALCVGNWKAYFQMNPFAVPLSIAFVICIHLTAMSDRYRNYCALYVVTTLVSNFGWYIHTLV